MAFRTDEKCFQPNNSLGQSGCSVQQRSALDDVTDRLSSAVQIAASLQDRLLNLEGRLLGGVAIADNAKASPPRPIPSWHVGQIGYGLDELFGRLNECEMTISRLGNVI